MGKVIAVAGKGGVGKTTIAALIIRYLREQGMSPILAVDCDPNTNLNMLLDMKVEKTIGSIREGGKTERPSGMSLHDFLDYQINMALVEGDKIDLISMGRPEGKGCYCAANNALRECLSRLSISYPWVVIDNEAGLEHISRQTNRAVDVLMIISDPSVRGFTTAIRIKELVEELENKVGQCFLIINRYNGELPDEWRGELKKVGLELAGILPVEPLVGNYDLQGKPIIELLDTSLFYQELEGILARIIIGTG
ncbi:MAG: AAA family ATPase [Candidatus Desantisbacteria bacterium]